jgi:hypothetical protein
MKDVRPLFDRVLSEAITAIRREGVRIHTFAFYHDHESDAVSVCVDTEESSKRLVVSSNAYNQKYFWPAVEKGDLEDAALWTANIGRSLSLGDFALVNLARTDLPPGPRPKDFYLEMVRALHAKEEEIVGLASSPESLLFCASGPNAEVGLTWASANGAKKNEPNPESCAAQQPPHDSC